MSKTVQDLFAEFQQAWDLAVVQENPTAMIEASWKQALFLGQVTDKVELRITMRATASRPIRPSSRLSRGLPRRAGIEDQPN